MKGQQPKRNLIYPSEKSRNVSVVLYFEILQKSIEICEILGSLYKCTEIHRPNTKIILCDVMDFLGFQNPDIRNYASNLRYWPFVQSTCLSLLVRYAIRIRSIYVNVDWLTLLSWSFISKAVQVLNTYSSIPSSKERPGEWNCPYNFKVERPISLIFYHI